MSAPRFSIQLMIVIALILCPAALLAENGKGDISLTVYSSADPAGFDPQRFIAQQRSGYNNQFVWQVPGFGVVKEIREVNLRDGKNSLSFTDVAQFIDPTTVSIKDLTDSDGTAVLEQNFQFDLVSSSKLLEKYLDQEIEVILYHGDLTEVVSGTLLSAAGQLVIQTDEGVRIVPNSGNVRLGKLPGGLITKPALVWQLNARRSGTHSMRTTYQTSGITWRADYNLVLNGSETAADLNAWVSLMNLSGASYKNARLKLIAGDVQRVQPGGRGNAYKMKAARMAVSEAAMDVGFREKSFFEYHLYTLPRRTDVLSNQTQQITLFPPASGVKTSKKLVYYGLQGNWSMAASPYTDRNMGNQSNKKLDVYIEFENKKDNSMGMPLPAGKVRVYKADEADGTLEFVGEDLIDHTPRDEKVLIKLGQSFDVVGERTQTDFHIDSSRRSMRESFKVVLRNHKDVAQDVIIKENLFRWVNWEITRHSAEFEKKDARTIHFPVTVPAAGEKIVTYTVQYSW